MITTVNVPCDIIKKFCLLCNRKFSIRNASCCPTCWTWRQLCQVCVCLEGCSIIRCATA